MFRKCFFSFFLLYRNIPRYVWLFCGSSGIFLHGLVYRTFFKHFPNICNVGTYGEPLENIPLTLVFSERMFSNHWWKVFVKLTQGETEANVSRMFSVGWAVAVQKTSRTYIFVILLLVFCLKEFFFLKKIPFHCLGLIWLCENSKKKKIVPPWLWLIKTKFSKCFIHKSDYNLEAQAELIMQMWSRSTGYQFWCLMFN